MKVNIRFYTYYKKAACLCIFIVLALMLCRKPYSNLCSIGDFTVEYNKNGIQVTEVTDYELLSDRMRGYICNAYEVSLIGNKDDNLLYGSSFKGKCRVSFYFDTNLDETFRFMPCIYLYDDETQLLHELPTEVIGNRAVAEVDGSGVYVLLNKVYVDNLIYLSCEQYSDMSSSDRNQDGITDGDANLISSGVIRTGTNIIFNNMDWNELDSDCDGLLNSQEVEIVDSGDYVYLKVYSFPDIYDE